jgi:hypothetical protein
MKADAFAAGCGRLWKFKNQISTASHSELGNPPKGISTNALIFRKESTALTNPAATAHHFFKKKKSGSGLLARQKGTFLFC